MNELKQGGQFSVYFDNPGNKLWWPEPRSLWGKKQNMGKGISASIFLFLKVNSEFHKN